MSNVPSNKQVHAQASIALNGLWRLDWLTSVVSGAFEALSQASLKPSDGKILDGVYRKQHNTGFCGLLHPCMHHIHRESSHLDENFSSVLRLRPVCDKA